MTIHQFLQSSPTGLLLSAFVLGCLVGSFLNVVAYRLPVMLRRDWKRQCDELFGTRDESAPDDEPQAFNLLTPGSHCPHCKHRIRALENIPLLSYLFLRGRCAGCRQPISPRYPLVELCCGILSAVVAVHFGYGWPLLWALVLTWSLLALSLIDFDTQFLPDLITLPLLWLGLLLSLWGIYTDPENAIIGALAGYLSLWLVFQLFKLLTGKEGMGYGDFKLFAALGAWLGWKFLPLIIVLSSFVGAVIGILLILIKGRDKNIPIPFGPYLAAAGWIALLWGQDILDLYFRIYFTR